MRVKPPIRIEGDIAYVPLSRGLEAVIDASDVDLVSAHTWSAARYYNIDYATTRIRSEGGRGRTIGIHRLLLGDPAGLVVDHRDRDGLNNRRSNLRQCTDAQNARNTGLKRSNSSGFKGVSWRHDRQKWQVHIRVDGKRLSLGHFETAELAGAAYAKAADDLHGEFARTA